MIWHVRADELIRFVEAEGFRKVAETDRHDVDERGSERIQIRRSDTLTQAEVDLVCDTADLPPLR